MSFEFVLQDYERRYSKPCVNFHSKVYDHSLDEYIPGLSQNLDNFDNLVDPLFDFPVSWRDMIAPSILTMPAIALRDACLYPLKNMTDFSIFLLAIVALICNFRESQQISQAAYS